VTKADAKPGNGISVRKYRGICIPDIDVLSQVQRARATGPAVHSTPSPSKMGRLPARATSARPRKAR
jgi:hypothetical protein